MGAVHLRGNPRRAQVQAAPQNHQTAPRHTPPQGVIVVGLSPTEKLSSLLINGGIELVMGLVLYFGWNFGLYGIGGIIRQDLYHWGWYWTFNTFYDLNIGLHHLIPLTVSLIEWRFMPYEKVAPIWFFRFSRNLADVVVFGIGGKTGVEAKTPLQKWVWWINLVVLDVGTTYGGVALFYASGVSIPLPGINLMLATAGVALIIQATITAVIFALLPEPVMRRAGTQLIVDFGR